MLLNIIKDILQSFIDKIDNGSCEMSTEKLIEVLHYLGTISEPNEIMSKSECCDYLGISRATFDNHVKDGLIPHGFTKGGLQKFWNKTDIDIFNIQYNNLEKV